MPVRRVSMISFHTCPLASQEGKETGGMNVYVLELSKELSRQGIAVDVFTRSQDNQQPYVVQVEPLFRVIHLPAGPESPVPKKQLIQYLPEFVRNYQRFVEQQGLTYDVMHCHYYLSGLAALDIVRQPASSNLPLIMTFHTLALMKNLVARDELEREETERIDAEFQLVREVQKIIAPSESDKAYLQYLYRAEAAKVEVIPPGVNMTHFKPIDQQQARRKLNISLDERLILFCGRIEPLKGIDMLLYAMKILVEKAPQLKVCLWIIGGDISQPGKWSRELQKLEKLRHLLKLTAVVHFAGQQPQEILPNYYNAADVVVMPSHYESFGMAAAEAMACGVPVITTNVAGISGLIDEKHELLITSVNNPLLLASQMELLLTDQARHRQISQDVRPKVQDLSWPNITYKVIQLYEAALNDVTQHTAVVHL